MKISDHKKGNICIVEVSGALTHDPDVDRLTERFDELIEQGERQFVFDMMKVPWMDDSGINASIACRGHLQDRNKDGEIKIAVRGKSHSLFVVFGLHRIFDLHEDVESALAAFAVKA